MKEYLKTWRRPTHQPYTDNCLIWNEGHASTITELWEPTGPNSYVLRGHWVISERAGGSYVLWQKTKPLVESLNEQEKARLTTWVIDQRVQGDFAPEITKENVEYAKQRHNLQIQERAERLLNCLASQADTIGTGIDIQADTHSPYAWSESTRWEEVVYLLNYLRDSGWLDHTGTHNRIDTTSGLVQGVVTVAGFNQISDPPFATDTSQAFVEVSKMTVNSVFQEKQFTLNERLIFVLSPFGEPFDTIFTDHVKPTVEKIERLNCLRADDIYDNRPVIDDIWRFTNEARMLIAELTGKNANVFYEAGLAHAIGKEVILIAQSMNDVPFDLKHRRCIVYEYTPKGIDKLQHDLTYTITSILDRTDTSNNESGSVTGQSHHNHENQTRRHLNTL